MWPGWPRTQLPEACGCTCEPPPLLACPFHLPSPPYPTTHMQPQGPGGRRPVILACWCGGARCRPGLSVRVYAVLAGAGRAACAHALFIGTPEVVVVGAIFSNWAASSCVPCRVACLLFIPGLFCKLLRALKYLSICKRQGNPSGIDRSPVVKETSDLAEKC